MIILRIITLRMTTPRITTLRITTLRMTILRMTTLRMITLRMTTLRMTTLRIKTLKMITLRITTLRITVLRMGSRAHRYIDLLLITRMVIKSLQRSLVAGIYLLTLAINSLLLTKLSPPYNAFTLSLLNIKRSVYV